MVTLMKNYTDDGRNQKKIYVKKIVSLKNVLNKSISEVIFKILSINEINKLKSLGKEEGKTKITIQLAETDKIYVFRLNENRKVDHKLLDSLKMNENIIIN